MIPASTALIKLNYDDEYRHALQQADLVLPDSGLARLWRFMTGRKLNKISRIDYLRHLLAEQTVRQRGNTFWILATDLAKEKALAFLREHDCDVAEDCCHIASRSSSPFHYHSLLFELEERRPQHIVIALPRHGQETLGVYFRDYLLYRPAIHCVGGALGFLTGEHDAILGWAHRPFLGWLLRLAWQVSTILIRVGIAFAFGATVFRYRSDLPPLRSRWTDL